MASITQWFLVPVFMVSKRNAWHNDPLFVYKIRQNIPGGYFQKNWVGVCSTLPETLTLFQTKISDFPYPISDLIKNLILYFRPEALEPHAWLECVTSCYSTYKVVGVNVIREMVLSQNDEEVAKSSKKNTQFKTVLECTNHTLFQAKMAEIDTPFQPKRLKNHTHYTYVYSLDIVSLLTQGRLMILQLSLL